MGDAMHCVFWHVKLSFDVALLGLECSVFFRRVLPYAIDSRLSALVKKQSNTKNIPLKYYVFFNV
jgi:hypothetical protein